MIYAVEKNDLDGRKRFRDVGFESTVFFNDNDLAKDKYHDQFGELTK